MKGILNSHPPKPRYSHTWDVKKVTAHLTSLGSNSSLSLKHLSRKLVMLFASACLERAASLAKLDLRYCKILPEGVVFSLTSPRKRGNPSHLAQAFFTHFLHNWKLYPVETLCHYLKWCPVCHTLLCSKPDPLLISYIKPHKQVSSATVGCWFRLTIKDAGINMEIFKAHSVHSASTTAAANGSVSLDEIMTMADWSSPSTFQKLYYKPGFNSKYCYAVLKQPSFPCVKAFQSVI